MTDFIKRMRARCEMCGYCHKSEFNTESGKEVDHQCNVDDFYADVKPDGWCYKYERKK